MPDGKTSAPLISRNSGITIGLAVTALVSLFGGFTWISSGLNGIRDELRGISTRVERIEEQREQSWTRQEQIVWALRLEKANPTLTVPDAD